MRKEKIKQYVKKVSCRLLGWLIKHWFRLAIFCVAVAILVLGWYSGEQGLEFAKILGNSIDSSLEYLIDSGLGYFIGGLLFILQIYVSNRRATAAEETAKAMQKTAELTESGNISERFKNAIEHLGNESASIRLGGIYALHHIAQEVEEYRKRVFEILCAHIRETTTKPEYKILKDTSDGQVERTQPTIEIQSILNLLFIESQGKEIYRGLKANLEGANLNGARLEHANLQRAYLQDVNLQAYLFNANLQNAYLYNANLQNAYLFNANLQNVYLEHVQNLEIVQLFTVKTLFEAKLPDGMKEKIMKKKPKLFEPPKAEQES